MNKLPNFLIVGAAKSGTTSLYYYLKEHPQVFLSPVKEPKFITSQFLKFPLKGVGDPTEKDIIKNFEDYKKLFDNVENEIAIGEASPDNLYFYELAIPTIKKYLNTPKIIIILRNPVERAFSAYLYLVRDNREYLSFEEALNEEQNRKNNNWSFIWYYKEVGLYYNQVKAYMENFPQVKVFLYEDLKNKPKQLLRELFEFLEVDTSFIPSNLNVRYNVSGIPKNRFLYNFITKPNLLKKTLRPFLPKGLRMVIKNKLSPEALLEKPKMKSETREYLKNFYREDIIKLQDLIKRDLSNWLE